MNPLLKEIRHNPLLWMLIFVPLVLLAEWITPSAHTFLFVLAILAIVPLAALLSQATESVAEKTGDAIGGLLNATLGNLTELIIAIAALQAGEYLLVKASIAGAIVTNALCSRSSSCCAESGSQRAVAVPSPAYCAAPVIAWRPATSHAASTS
jgi:Ca2+:H+ antiporter